MTQTNAVYKCFKCGNITEVLHMGDGQLTCCEKPMILLKENTEDASTEKHVPIVTQSGDTISVVVGSIPHPMEDDHYIEWIELVTETEVYRKNLKPGDEPKAVFHVLAKNFSVREYCNLHGLWKT